MPLIFHHTDPDGAKISLWKIEEGELSPHKVPTNFFNKDRFEAIHHEEIKAQFLASRMALAAIAPHDQQLCFMPSGKPFFEKGYLSLSHTTGFAAAIYHPEKPCGIDIEREDRLLSDAVRKRFLHPEEQAWLEEKNRNPIYFWCAKEAIYKAAGESGLQFNTDIRLALTISPQSEGWSKGIKKGNWSLKTFEEHKVVLVCAIA